MMGNIAIAVWSPSALFAAGMTTILQGAADIDVVSIDGDANPSLVMIANRTVDVDVRRQISYLHSSSARILLLVDDFDDADVDFMSNRRVVAMLARSSATSESLIRTVREVHQDHAMPCLADQATRIKSSLIDRYPGPAPALGSNERDVLRLLAQGYDTAAIAKEVAYSERSVKNIVRSILDHLHAKNRAHAVALATRKDLV
jgi:DNA-binding NarL/FixJ family response regulator